MKKVIYMKVENILNSYNKYSYGLLEKEVGVSLKTVGGT